MDLTVAQRSFKQIGVSVAVDVDESGAYDPVGCVNPVVAVASQLSDGSNLAVTDSYIGAYGLFDFAVVNKAVGNDGIKLFAS